MKKNFIKAVQEGDTVRLQSFGITLVTIYANGFKVFSKSVTLTPTMEQELQQRLGEIL